MKNLIKEFQKRLHSARMATMEMTIQQDIESDIRIANDPKDPNNKVYIYVKGVPVLCVGNNSDLQHNMVSIDDANSIVAAIKDMYRNSLKHKKVK